MSSALRTSGRAMMAMPVVALLLALPGMANDTKPSKDTTLERMAETATTARDHVRVAKQYRLRAQEFEAKANKLESEARRLEAQPRGPMAHKWPAMAPQPWIKMRQQALEMRRASRECLEVADHHMRLGVEALADRGDVSTDRASGGN